MVHQMMNSMNRSGIAFGAHVRLSRSQLVAIELMCTEAQLVTKFVSKSVNQCENFSLNNVNSRSLGTRFTL